MRVKNLRSVLDQYRLSMKVVVKCGSERRESTVAELMAIMLGEPDDDPCEFEGATELLIRERVTLPKTVDAPLINEWLELEFFPDGTASAVDAPDKATVEG
jgi:hypothetical protein